MANERFTVVGTNIAEKAAMIWNVAYMLRGPFKPHEYGLVILPMTVVKRFHDCLLPTHDVVMKEYDIFQHKLELSGFNFQGEFIKKLMLYGLVIRLDKKKYEKVIEIYQALKSM